MLSLHHREIRALQESGIPQLSEIGNILYDGPLTDYTNDRMLGLLADLAEYEHDLLEQRDTNTWNNGYRAGYEDGLAESE